MNPADTMSEGMDLNHTQGILMVGARESSRATDTSDDWVRRQMNIPILMNAPYETSDSTLQVSSQELGVFWDSMHQPLAAFPGSDFAAGFGIAQFY